MSRRIIYLLLFVALMGVAVAIPLWRELDWRVYRLLMGKHLPPLAGDIVLIDLPYQHNLELFRSHQGQLLRFLAGQGSNLPRAAVLDIAFAEDETGAEPLSRAIDTLTTEQVPVYAAYDPQEANKQLYGRLSGWGHTAFHENIGTFFYNTILPANDPRSFPKSKAQPGEEVVALPVRMAVDQKILTMMNQSTRRMVYVGNSDDIRSRTLRFEPGASGGRLVSLQGDATVSLRGKTVIVGSMEEDRPQAARGLSGPELLAWAVSDLIAPTAGSKPMSVLAGRGLLTAMVFCFGAFAAGLFALMFRLFHRWHSRLWLIFGITSATGVIVLAGVVAGLRMTDTVYPRVTLVVLAIMVSAGLSWHYFAKLLERLAFETDLRGGPEGERNEYDIFISYSHTPEENIAWVERNLYEPLSRIKKMDGTPLRIFFDKKSIKGGISWYKKIARSIEGSRVFIPVYSMDYFDKAYCRFEMERAAIKRVNNEDFMLPLMRELKDRIPVEYNHVQYLDVSAFPDFINEVTSRLPDRMLRES